MVSQAGDEHSAFVESHDFDSGYRHLDSNLFHNLVHVEFVFGFEHHVGLHNVDLEQHVLCLSDELLAHLSCLFVGFKLRVLLAGV